MGQMTAFEKAEYKKCRDDFVYFAETYVKIMTTEHGYQPFKLYEFQKRVISECDQHRFSIVCKFRQAGLTLVVSVWALWRCMFKKNQNQIMIVSKSDRESTGVGQRISGIIEKLPEWLKPALSGQNKHEILFTETDASLQFRTVHAARSLSLSFLIIDEAAFINQMHEHWKALYPTLSNGGKCVVISTVNGKGNWFHQQYMDAKADTSSSEGKFHIIDLDYTEHPVYAKPGWAEMTRRVLGEKEFAQEYLRDFGSSGDTFIPPSVIRRYELGMESVKPIKILYAKYDNRDVEEHDRGALQIWKMPVESREYVLSIDTGLGEGVDYSAFQVLDTVECEQVAEFYSNTIKPKDFSEIAASMGNLYNQALAVIDTTGYGFVTLDSMQKSLHYENIHFDQRTTRGAKPKAGMHINVKTRDLIIECLHSYMVCGAVKIYSRRLIHELDNFIYNESTHKVEAKAGFHDDLVFSLAMGLRIVHVRFNGFKVNMNVAALDYEERKDNPDELTRYSLRGVLEELFDREGGTPDTIVNRMMPTKENLFLGEILQPQRDDKSILAEFGWWTKPNNI